MPTETTRTPSKVIILLGAPGSGKGTQAKVISQQLSIPHISTGDLFRINMSQKSPLGERARSYMDAGKLVPDEIVIEMLKQRITNPDCTNGYLLDGFPRTIFQAEELEKILEKDSKLLVINFQVPDETIVKRIEGRVSCADCGALYNTYFSPPKKQGFCDICQGALIHRADDTASIVNERLKVYHTQTVPLEKFYAEKGLLQNINGNRSTEIIYGEVLTLITN